MIARPVRRTGPIPFASNLPHGLMAGATSPSPQASAHAWHTHGGTPTWMATHGGGSGSGSSSDARNNRGAGSGMGDGLGGSSGGHSGRAGRAHPGAHTGGMPPKPAREFRATFFGHGVLSVRSSATGALYRFDGHGTSLVIDPRDALLLGRLTDVRVE